MASILVITHGNLAKEFVHIAESITGHTGKAIPICFEFDLDPNEYTDKISTAIESLDSDKPIIVLTDLFGGTPSNLAIPFVQKDRVEVLTGLNLPMLLYLLTQAEDKDFEQLCQGAKQSAKEAIIVAGEFLQ